MNLNTLMCMSGEEIHNYILPGLTSRKIATGEDGGMVRMFEMTAQQQGTITPHSHRFDLTCCVLHGEVLHQRYKDITAPGDTSEYQYAGSWVPTWLKYDGAPGHYSEPERRPRGEYCVKTESFVQGDWYQLKYNEIHSVAFARTTKLLLFEGPPQTDVTTLIEPYVNGERIPTFRVEPWMFQTEEKQ